MEHLANTPLTNNVLQHLGTHNSSFLGVDSCLCYGTSGTKLLGMEHIIYIKNKWKPSVDYSKKSNILYIFGTPN